MASTAPALKETRPVFACAGVDYTVGDVIDAAHFRAELASLWRQFLMRLTADDKGREGGGAIDDEAIDAAAVAFRYQYDLITAEETEGWLDARGLNLAEFSEYFARLEWGKQFAGRVEVADVRFEDASPEQRELFIVDLTLSGDLDVMAKKLAWRTAAWDGAKNAIEDAALEAERERFFARAGVTAETSAQWVSSLGREPEWLEEMLAMEVAYHAACDQRLTNEARERELSAVRLPLTRFEVEMIELESRDAAREAFMCVRDDGMTMAEVAQEGRYPFHRTEMVLEQIADDLQQKFLSLTPGSLLDPMPREDGYLLTRILQKKEPTLADAKVRERVEQRILERHFADVSSGRVQWRIPMNGAE